MALRYQLPSWRSRVMSRPHLLRRQTTLSSTPSLLSCPVQSESRAGGSRYQRIEIQEEQPEDAAFWEAEENKRAETDVGNAHGPPSLRL
ncbi:hypothetical protein B0H14DRAFT_3519352 [Mycena olivaceomarginata]|nr:hypothetical protein B0H14DRAFT_3519352 [Mycena olivaceomarginata]